MTSKKKMIISITSICVVLVLAVASIAIVWAAINASVTGNVTVTYTATEIRGAVGYNRYTNGAWGTGATVDYDGNEEDGEITTLDAADVVLTKAAQYVVFEWSFNNDSTADGGSAVPYKATLTWTQTKNTGDNVSIKYLATTSKITDADLAADKIATTFASATTPTSGEALTSIEVAAADGTTTSNYAYVIAQIVNDKADADFAGSFSWALAENRA